ncbi:MAG TPA: hypothetical protein VGN96_03055 [Roseococcus sp.]|jgi:hypothetical protein|nr:hypothetical protein [Roseococcus sp.]
MKGSVSMATRRHLLGCPLGRFGSRLQGRLALGWMAAALLAGPAFAQAPASPPAPAAGQAAQPAQAPSNQWQELTPMVVERVFRGPLRDTLVQRLRDPVDGATCFIFLPMSAGVTGQGQFLVYGPNTIGSISCFAPAQVIQLQPLAPPPPPPPARSR